jgi:moderate conductance mechanosensitive channel
VMAAMRDAAATLMSDPAFKPHILEPLEIYGVDAFQKGQLVLKGRIKTVPLKQWLVGRELQKRMAKIFGERGITAPVDRLVVTVENESSPRSQVPKPKTQVRRQADDDRSG